MAALKQFLKLAKDGYADVAEATGRGFDSEFEESVALAIKELGYDVHPQVGMAVFLWTSAGATTNSNRYLLGVECDGAAYHSSSYSRDRDRLRQEILEARGWRIHRLWSTDWFYRQEREIAKSRIALEAALQNNAAPKTSEVYRPAPAATLAHQAEASSYKDHSSETKRQRALTPYLLSEVRPAERQYAHLTNSGQLGSRRPKLKSWSWNSLFTKRRLPEGWREHSAFNAPGVAYRRPL